MTIGELHNPRGEDYPCQKLRAWQLKSDLENGGDKIKRNAFKI